MRRLHFWINTESEIWRAMVSLGPATFLIYFPSRQCKDVFGYNIVEPGIAVAINVHAINETCRKAKNGFGFAPLRSCF
jgi:hypothetical protein